MKPASFAFPQPASISEALTLTALDAIVVDIEALGLVLDRETAHAAKSLLFEANDTNVAAHYTVTIGDAGGTFATADYTRRERFRRHRHTAAPMETRGMVGRMECRGPARTHDAHCPPPLANPQPFASDGLH
jgi:CO/xanthine dehydrogenase Mo-binding subunit